MDGYNGRKVFTIAIKIRQALLENVMLNNAITIVVYYLSGMLLKITSSCLSSTTFLSQDRNSLFVIRQETRLR